MSSDPNPPDRNAKLQALLERIEKGAADGPNDTASQSMPGVGTVDGTDSASKDKPDTADPSSWPALAPPGYEITGELGRGAMGVVYQARQRGLNRLVALKMVLGADRATPRQLIRFLAEAEAVAAVKHANVVQVHEYGEHNGRPYLVLEFLSGGTLAAHLDAKSKLPPRDAAELMTKLARGVHAAHDLGIIHRDLKPGNVLFDQAGEPKVTDFGLAKRDVGANLTATQEALGTPAYMAPEQAKGESKYVGPPADVHALGVILYECLTGTRPFTGDSSWAVLQQVMSTDAVPPSKHTDVPRDLELICLKCLEKEPSQRYQSAAALADDLERFNRGEPVTARPPSVVYQVRRFVGRNAGVSIAAGLFVLALVGGIVGTSWMAVKADQARANEAEQSKLAKDSAKKANEERERAETEKQVALAVRNFLQLKLLRLADPHAQADSLLNAGRSSSEVENDPKVSVLLDRAAGELAEGKIERVFPNQPLVQAEILQVIGEAYAGMTKYDRAVSHLERARDVRMVVFGFDHADTLSLLRNLATAYWNAGKQEQAIGLYEKVIAGQTKLLATNNIDAIATVNLLGLAYRETGRLSEAVQTLERMRDPVQKQFGIGHRATLSFLDNLAGTYLEVGRLAEAIELMEIASRGMEKLLGADHPEALVGALNLASAYLYGGRMPEAIATFERTLAIQKKRVGGNQNATLITQGNLAYAYEIVGKYDEAIGLLESTHGTSVKQLGPEHPTTNRFAANLAKVYSKAGRPQEAIPILVSVVAIQARTLPADHGDALLVLNLLAWAYLRADQFAESESVLRKLLPILQKQQADLPLMFVAQARLGAALLGQKKYQEAESLLVAGHAGISKRREQIPPDDFAIWHKEFAGCLVRLYDEWGKPEEAAKWRTELEELKKSAAAKKPGKSAEPEK